MDVQAVEEVLPTGRDIGLVHVAKNINAGRSNFDKSRTARSTDCELFRNTRI